MMRSPGWAEEAGKDVSGEAFRALSGERGRACELAVSLRFFIFGGGCISARL